MAIKAFFARHKKTILVIIVVLLAARVFIPQLDVLADSIEALTTANPWLIILASILYFTGIPVLAAQFNVLSFKKLVYSLTLRVQAATMFVNKILPQGVGTISLNIYYFIKKGHTPSQAVAGVTMNSITSLVAYIFLIIGALIFSDVSVAGIFQKDEARDSVTALAILCVVGLIITLISMKNLRKKIANALKTFKSNIATFKDRPKSVLIATAFNGLGTSLNILALILCAKAIGVDISFADALIAYTFGNFAAALVPTPGGIGSAEMGIYSGLVLTGVDPTLAISITLLYRFVSYWLPILPGYYYFHSLKKTIFADYNIGKQKTSVSE